MLIDCFQITKDINNLFMNTLFEVSEKNNAEALKKLPDLDKTGCPVP